MPTVPPPPNHEILSWCCHCRTGGVICNTPLEICLVRGFSGIQSAEPLPVPEPCSKLKSTSVQASGKRFSLFNRPISSPASYEDLAKISPADIDTILATSPKAPIQDLGRRSRSNLDTISEVTA